MYILQIFPFQKKSTFIQSIWDIILFIEQTIPKSLRICDSIFTQMILCSDVGISPYIEKHKDDKDIITCILTLGEVSIGGKLRFSSKKICPSDKIVHDISFGHGQLVKGQFCHIIHDIET